MKANDYFIKNCRDLISFGDTTPSRPKYQDGTPTKSIAIKQVFEEYDLTIDTVIHNFRPTAIRNAIQEVLWIYQDRSNGLDDAHKRGIFWWDDFDVGDNSIGSAYGKVVENYNLIQNLLTSMEENPFSRRHIMNLWQEGENDSQEIKGGLLPCAYETLWDIDSNYNVSLTLIQRSNDFITAGAINKIQYVALGMMICGHLTYKTGIKHTLTNFVHYVHNLHIYDRHQEALIELMNRIPSNTPQTIELVKECDFFDYNINDFIINKIPIEGLRSNLELAI